MDSEKVFLLLDDDDKVVAVAEEKKLLKKFMHQNNLDKSDFVIDKIYDSERIKYYLSKYDDKIVHYLGLKDIVAQSIQLDQIYDIISQFKYNCTETSNHLKYASELNITEDERKVLEDALKVLHNITSDERIYGVMRDIIIYYLSRESANVLKEIQFMKNS